MTIKKRKAKVISETAVHAEKSFVQNDNLAFYALISLSALYVLYNVFYYFAPYIRSFNLQVDPLEITSYLRPWLAEHDGIETYVLFIMMYVNIILCLLIYKLFITKKTQVIHLPSYKYILWVVLLFVSYVYLTGIGFHPPESVIAEKGTLVIVLGSVLLITGLLLLVYKYYNNASSWIIPILFAPFFFTPSNPVLDIDYNYIFAPALKLLNGFKLSDIYFQYDFLLSAIAAIWMKLDILPFFYIVGQLSYYLFIIGAFFFAKKYFINKTLPVYLVVSLLLVRFYAVFVDPVFEFQVTPLRLDLWFILLILVYIKGPRSWIVGVFVGFLLLTHSIFGVIYLAAYCVLVFTLFLLHIRDQTLSPKWNVSVIKQLLRGYCIPYLPNFLIISGFIILRLILFGELTSEAGSIYTKIGIGMIPISPLSFYWYFPVVQSLSFLLILRNKHSLSAPYVTTGILLIFLSIGNSIYFFGRSHEHNILNISGVLLFTVFLLFDLFQKTSTKNIYKTALNILPIIFIVVITYYYSGRIASKITAQYNNAANAEFTYHFTYPGPDINVINRIKEITHNSEKVYFLDFRDFWYYYLGNYAPPGKYQPCMAWVFKRDLVAFVQTLLDEDYYLVIHDYPEQEILPELTGYSIYSEAGYLFVRKSQQ